jgi:hypothetical protein
MDQNIPDFFILCKFIIRNGGDSDDIIYGKAIGQWSDLPKDLFNIAYGYIKNGNHTACKLYHMRLVDILWRKLLANVDDHHCKLTFSEAIEYCEYLKPMKKKSYLAQMEDIFYGYHEDIIKFVLNEYYVVCALFDQKKMEKIVVNDEVNRTG